MNKILLVESEPSLRHVLFDWLESEGYDVDQAANGRQAMEKIEGSVPDLVLLDFSLPEDGGLAAFKKIKGHSATGDVPIVVMTNLGNEYNRRKALEAGATDCIVKADNNLEQVSEIIKKALGK